MKKSYRVGLNFGLTSAVITTLGLMIGLQSGTGSRLAVIGGILTIAIADAFSDALGIHISEESLQRRSREIWESTIVTFFAKLIFALTFIIAVLLFDMSTAIAINIFWGLLLIGIFSYRLGSKSPINPWKAVGEHLLIAVIVIILSDKVGDLISLYFSS